MEAVRIEATVQPNGRIVVENLPFAEGDRVEVIVLEASDSDRRATENRLKGKLLKYQDPFEPAAPEGDWDVLK
jgi:hypothetical protein